MRLLKHNVTKHSKVLVELFAAATQKDLMHFNILMQ